ncbi:MAG: TetR/AcrR family transcriptional regulator, partial [Phenylobacterium sp.]|nr:TetR/AcrR family transcriptional regulator [Phenylobacterium sp.]
MGKGATTREAIVSQALDRAVQVGLSGLSLGPLAEDLNLSKSGLFAHFKSKETLQLAVLQEAIDRFTARVVEPGLRAPRGRGRMELLIHRWFDWIEGEPGMRGCLFSV